MRKSLIALFLALSVVAGSDAFASRARLTVAGTGDGGTLLDGSGVGGSMYVDDAYNMFYNPSYVNDYKDWGIIERSNGNSVTNSDAFGGFVTSMMNFNWGIFFNRTGALTQYNLKRFANATAANTATTAENGANMRPIELIMGGDAGSIKYGLGLSYARYRISQGGANPLNAVNTDMTLKLGAQFDGFDPFFNYKLIGRERGFNSGLNTESTRNHRDWMLGLRYHYGEWVPYAAVRQTKVGGESTRKTYGLGFARSSKVAEGVKLHYGFGLWRNAKNNPTSTGAVGNRDMQTVIPVDMSVEGDVTSWLALRAGLNYRLWSQTGKNTDADDTNGAVGASFKFGKLTMDWAVGSATEASATETTDSKAFGFDSGFFTLASVQYNW